MSYLGLFMETYKLSSSWFYVGEVVYMIWYRFEPEMMLTVAGMQETILSLLGCLPRNGKVHTLTLSFDATESV